MVLVLWKLDYKGISKEIKDLEDSILRIFSAINAEKEVFHRYNTEKEDFLPVIITVLLHNFSIRT